MGSGVLQKQGTFSLDVTFLVFHCVVALSDFSLSLQAALTVCKWPLVTAPKGRFWSLRLGAEDSVLFLSVHLVLLLGVFVSRIANRQTKERGEE